MRDSSWIVLALALVAGGCHASVKAKVGGSAEAKQEADFNEPQSVPIDQTKGSADNLAMGPELDAGVKRVLLGARHDVQLGDNRNPVCSCLAAHVGPPTDPAFKWEGAPPQTDPDSQLVVALTSEGVACDAKIKDSLGASYWGYSERGGDIVIRVEAARFGRPVTNGAVIPKPAAGGHVYIRPAHRKTPYGHSLDKSKKLCQVM